MDAQWQIEPGTHLDDRLGYLPWERPAVGVAEDQPFGTSVTCRFKNLHRVFRVVLPSVEEVFRVEDDLLARSGQETDRVRNDLQVLLQ